VPFEPFEQELQFEEEVPAQGLATPLKPHTESFFFTSSEPHFEQATLVWLKTSFSNSPRQELQTYS
jgi:hypothetical protein